MEWLPVMSPATETRLVIKITNNFELYSYQQKGLWRRVINCIAHISHSMTKARLSCNIDKGKLWNSLKPWPYVTRLSGIAWKLGKVLINATHLSWNNLYTGWIVNSFKLCNQLADIHNFVWRNEFFPNAIKKLQDLRFTLYKEVCFFGFVFMGILIDLRH